MSDSDSDGLGRHISDLTVPATTPVEIARRDVAARIARRQTRRQIIFGSVTLSVVVGAFALAPRSNETPHAGGDAGPPVVNQSAPSAIEAAAEPTVPVEVSPQPTTTAPSEQRPRLLVIEARNGPSGTELVTLVFDEPLPVPGNAGDLPDETTTPEPDVTFRTRGPAEALEACGVASAPPDPEANLSAVDVLIPATWLDPDTGTEQPTVRSDPDDAEYFDQLAKIIVCSEDNDLVQVTIMRPASIDRSHIDISVAGRSILIEIAPDQTATSIASSDPADFSTAERQSGD